MRSRSVVVPNHGTRLPWATVSGPRYQLRAELLRQEEHGEIRCHWERATVHHGTLTVRYVRLRPAPRWWVRAARTGVWVVASVASVVGYFYLLGVSLWAILGPYWKTFLGVLIGAPVLFWLVTRVQHSGGCVGLHCPGCRG